MKIQIKNNAESIMMAKKKILIVDDSRTVLMAIKSLINESYVYEPYYAENFEEAKKLIGKHLFFAAILDLELPDSSNGELVDYALSHAIRCIVLTATMDEKRRKKIVAKPIVDYIIKNSMEEIRHALDIASDLLYFHRKTAMIVDDSALARMQLKALFEALSFHVIEAANANEALNLLTEHSYVDVMTIDYQMPGMNGIELITKIRNFSSLKQPLIFAVTSSKSDMNKAMFIKSGANDYFKKPVQKEEFNHKLGNFFQILHQKEELVRSQKLLEEEQSRHSAFMKALFDKNTSILAVVDETGLLNINERFFDYFPHFETLERFNENHTCICELFEAVSDEHFLQPQKGVWIQKALEDIHSQVLIKHENQDYYFNVNADKISCNTQTFYIVTFTDITRTYLLQKKFEEYSMIDELTQAYNRRFFNTIFEKEISRAKRDQKTLTFLMLDVDNFKRYNDFYGHDAGDRVLTAISSEMQKRLKRSSDYLFRLGGEEFGILFLDQTHEESMIYADTVRESIYTLDIPHEQNNPYNRITISVGACTVDFARETLQSKDIYIQADKALYAAKQNGRNAIVSADQTRLSSNE